ncbi:MAG: hypothetical protein Q8Q14_02405 [Gemmatimonadales bacterium]|nr:hypothetical protein [Gemmatimonadales bacterium]
MAAAQWHLGIELSSSRYGGTAHDTTGTGPPYAGPGGGTGLGIRVDKSVANVRVSLRASYSTAGFKLSGEGIDFSDKSTGDVLEAVLLFGIRVGGIGPSGAARVELGPALHLWNLSGEVRDRIGAVGALAYEWPIAGRVSGAVRLEGMISRSWFEAVDLPPEYERRATRRAAVSLGLRYRL